MHRRLSRSEQGELAGVQSDGCADQLAQRALVHIPFPLLGQVRRSVPDQLPQARKRLPAPVRQVSDAVVDAFSWGCSR